MVRVESFGKYRIIHKLSRSMTDVYLACDTELNRRVALKLIEESRDDYTQVVIDAEKRGAALQTQLHQLDPRILEVYEYGEQNGCFFIAMEYCEGRTLAQLLQTDRRFDPRRAARYATEICNQLQTLHAFVSDINGRGTAVVHGDIKPANIQIGSNGHAPATRPNLRLLDFGIAKLITSTRNLTHHNLGSPSYCSPERISKSQVDPHCDLWAVGVTLYEMLAGAPPYQAQNTRKLENLIQSRRPPRALPSDCPAALKAIVAKALAGNIERRYPSAAAFAGDLEAFLDGRVTAAERERTSSWYTNSTVEKYTPGLESFPSVTKTHPAPSPLKQTSLKRQSLKAWVDFPNIVALLAGILVGLLVFIPIAYAYRLSSTAARLRASKDYAHVAPQTIASDWDSYRELKTQTHLLGLWSPGEPLDTAMRDHLIAAADDILDRFRHSTGLPFTQVDWSKAQLCLQHALEIDSSNTKAKGELALATGYLDLTRSHPDTADAIYRFEQTEWYLPRLPDPHLGLARVFVYQFHNIGRTIAEFHQAEQLGYNLGPREFEQEADGYLFRAEAELARAKRTARAESAERTKWLQLAHNDIERGLTLYEPIVGFSNVSTNLQQLRQDGEEQSKLQMENVRLVTPQPRTRKRYPWMRRWQ